MTGSEDGVEKPEFAFPPNVRKTDRPYVGKLRPEIRVRMTRPNIVNMRFTNVEYARLQFHTTTAVSVSDFIRQGVMFFIGYLEGCKDTQELQDLQAAVKDVAAQEKKLLKAAIAEKKAKMLEQELINKKRFWAGYNNKMGTRVNPPAHLVKKKSNPRKKR